MGASILRPHSRICLTIMTPASPPGTWRTITALRRILLERFGVHWPPHGGPGGLATMQAFTKWVPQPGPMPRPIVENNVAISLRRMGVETLDLLQFHWWDYEDSAYLDALTHLSHLREAGQLKHLA